MTDDQAQPVLAALIEQVDCYQRLAKLAEMQHEFVQNSQTDQLLDVLQRRQEVLDKISAMEKQIAVAKGAWPEFLIHLPERDRSSAEALLAETRQLLEKITTADRNDALVLQQRKLNLGQQLQRSAAARTLNRNYAASAYGGSKTSRLDVHR